MKRINKGERVKAEESLGAITGPGLVVEKGGSDGGWPDILWVEPVGLGGGWV